MFTRYVLSVVLWFGILTVISAAISVNEQGEIVFAVDADNSQIPMTAYAPNSPVGGARFSFKKSKFKKDALLVLFSSQYGQAGVLCGDILTNVFCGNDIKLNRNTDVYLNQAVRVSKKRGAVPDQVLSLLKPNGLVAKYTITFSRGLKSASFRMESGVNMKATNLWERLLYVRNVKCSLIRAGMMRVENHPSQRSGLDLFPGKNWPVERDFGGGDVDERAWTDLKLESTLEIEINKTFAKDLIELSPKKKMFYDIKGDAFHIVSIKEDQIKDTDKPVHQSFGTYADGYGLIKALAHPVILEISQGSLASALGIHVRDQIFNIQDPAKAVALASVQQNVGAMRAAIKNLQSKKYRNTIVTILIIKPSGFRIDYRCSLAHGFISARLTRSYAATKGVYSNEEFNWLRMELINLLRLDGEIDKTEGRLLAGLRHINGLTIQSSVNTVDVDTATAIAEATESTNAGLMRMSLNGDRSVQISNKVSSKGEAVHSDFGMWVDQKTNGVVVTKIHEGGLGKGLGIWVGDLVLSIDQIGKKVELGCQDIQTHVGCDAFEDIEKLYVNDMKPGFTFSLSVLKPTGVRIDYTCCLQSGMLSAKVTSPLQLKGVDLSNAEKITEFSLIKQELLKVLLGDGSMSAWEMEQLTQLEKSFLSIDKIAKETGQDAPPVQEDEKTSVPAFEGNIGLVKSFTAGTPSVINIDVGSERHLNKNDIVIIKKNGQEVARAQLTRVGDGRSIAEIDTWSDGVPQVIEKGDPVYLEE